MKLPSNFIDPSSIVNAGAYTSGYMQDGVRFYGCNWARAMSFKIDDFAKNGDEDKLTALMDRLSRLLYQQVYPIFENNHPILDNLFDRKTGKYVPIVRFGLFLLRDYAYPAVPFKLWFQLYYPEDRFFEPKFFLKNSFKVNNHLKRYAGLIEERAVKFENALKLFEAEAEQIIASTDLSKELDGVVASTPELSGQELAITKPTQVTVIDLPAQRLSK